MKKFSSSTATAVCGYDPQLVAASVFAGMTAVLSGGRDGLAKEAARC